MKKYILKSAIICLLIVSFAFLAFFATKNQIKSAPVINIKDQMSNAQFSYFARLSGGNASIINIGTSANPSTTTANLATGDSLAIATNVGAGSTIYTVKDILDADSIEISSNIGTTIASSYIVATRSAVHTISFTPQSSILGEKWQFLIKATNRTGESVADGMPDQAGFDLGTLTASDVTCPLSGTPTAVGATVVITSGVSIGATGTYHVIECTGGATTTVGVATSMVVGRTTGGKLINPSPGTTHSTAGQADTYYFAIRQLDGSNNIIDTTFSKIAAVESVRVTAIVDPTITFTINNTGVTSTGTTLCTSPIGNGAPNTTATSVSFGPLVLGTYNNLAQQLTCTTNSQSGYVIQTFENHPMTMLGTTTTIPDTNCNGGGCTTSTSAAWTTFTNSGFGYALQVGTTSTGAVLGITTAGQYKAFAVGDSNAQTILSRTNTPSGTDSIYVCYRATASNFQQAGTYENMVSYIATATF